jgi:streptomycin 6-kinase
MIQIPVEYAAGVRRAIGEAGDGWLAQIPAVVERFCGRWGLRVDGEPRYGHLGLVVPVRRGEEACALKVAWVDESTRHEARALAIWDGRGTVRLFEGEPEQGVFLLERLDGDRSLNDVPLDRAVAVVGELVGVLSIEGAADLPTMVDWASQVGGSLRERWEQFGRPMPERIVRMAVDLAKQVPGSSDRRMVNWDLHYGNVLAGKRMPWLVIDPKALVGAPEFGLTQLLWRRLEERSCPAELRRHLQILVETAGLDAQLARAWTLVRVVDYWLWALSIGLTEDPVRCETVIEWLGY